MNHRDVGRLRQAAIYLRGLAGRLPRVPVDAAALEARAREVLSRQAFAYIAGGAGTEATMAANRAAFERHKLTPRVLRNAESRDLSVTLFGRRLPAPLLTAPIGVLEMAHPEADLAVARAAASLGVPMIFSNQASVAMEQCAAAMGESPRWFQLYWSKSDALVESFVHRAEACGCDAIVLTLDTTVLGWRPRDLDLGSLPFLEGKGIAQYTSDPVFRAALNEPLPDMVNAPRASVTFASIMALIGGARRYPGSTIAALRSGESRRAIQRFIATYSRPSLDWNDLATLRRMTTLPILLKGILRDEDACLAIDAGMNGVIVSNHGGRQIDRSMASLDALPSIVHAVEDRVPVLFDSGIRTGADVAVALSLGATAVCVGRPYAYGLAIAGEAGVHDVLTNILAELDLTLGLFGCTSIADLRAL
ncbi:MAG TPA: alpha-hydroxy-acid oxidizing protein [Gemmatimonadaceae bacterium]|nr:alpha-hydroxy-acid oxidizing protein [Gemmatimonadaceae bacterium]